MAEQTVLFAEDVYDALRDVVRCLGGNKIVGAKMRPELPTDDAGNWLKDCLNPARREKLDPAQVIWLLREGRKAGCHSGMHYINDEAGYVRAQPIEPQDEAAALQRAFIESVKQQKGIAARLERLGVLT